MTIDQMLHHPRAFIGIPWVARGVDFDGADCWGLIRLAAHHLYGLDFPAYFYSERDLLTEAAALIEHETRGPHWNPIYEGQRLAPGMVHIFRIAGFKTHCGLCLGGNEFLHSLPGHESAIEDLTGIQWRQRRTGTYEWKA